MNKSIAFFKINRECKHRLNTAKRLLILFAVLLVILAVANIGIAFAAAKLAKDTTVQDDVLVVKGTDTSVATNSHADLYHIETTQQAVSI